jgi:hypothetical protein
MTEAVSVEAVMNATPAEDETIWERRMRALTLRNAGATFRQIGEKTGVSAVVARRDVSLALREVIAESAEDMIARQRSILFDIQRANYSAAASGDIDAAKVILSTLEREARLFGLDAPTRVNVGVSDVEFAEKTASLIQSLGLQPPRELAVMSARVRETLDGEVVEDDDPFGRSDSGGVALEGPVVVERPCEGWSNI